MQKARSSLSALFVIVPTFTFSVDSVGLHNTREFRTWTSQRRTAQVLEVREGFIRRGRKEIWKCHLDTTLPQLPVTWLYLPSVVSSCVLIILLWTPQSRHYLEVPEIWIRALSNQSSHSHINKQDWPQLHGNQGAVNFQLSTSSASK